MQIKREKLHVLLVEDNPDDVELTERAFQKNHLVNPIDIARDGAEALDYLFQRGAHASRKGFAHPLLVLLDIKLPKVDGIEVLRQIKADPILRRIPVIMLTSSNQERDMVASYDLGVNSYIVKPVDFHKFSQAVASLGIY